MPVSRERKTGNRRISLQEVQDGRFQPVEDTCGALVIIPESFVAFCAVVFARIANEQTNKQTELHEVRASQLAQASERVGSLIPASQQG